jgi:plastocyanin
MKRIGAITLLVVTVAAGTASLAFGAHKTQHPRLIGTVGKNDAYKISLNAPNGKIAKTLKPGTYTFVIHDDSSLHNYELDGPHGKSWTFTSVSYKGTKTLTLKLAAGAYKAYCEPHESVMFQHFTVK